MIGFYGGTFDPIHFGHLNMAVEMLEKQGLEEIWFCPARTNPLKLNREAASIEHRMHMVDLAIHDVPQFKILDIESKREGPSYTVATLREIIDKNREFRLLLSEETAGEFGQWREPEEIINLAPPLVGSRGAELPNLEGSLQVIAALKRGWISTRVMDISSTEIRERLQKGLYCAHLVPKKVLDYIYKNHLYSMVNE